MEHVIRGRRLALAALSAFALVVATPALAQDPRYSEAQAAARAWLALADANDTMASYNTTAKKFQDAMPMDQWTAAMTQARQQFGAVKTRTMIGTESPTPAPGTLPGEYVVIAYRTEFEKRQTGTETLTLEHESDGKWRVVGYLMR
jgi:hypothetical protein